jgi:hypothetical protein
MIAMPCFANCRSQFVAALVTIVLSGCAPEAHRFAQSFGHPGPAAYQRAEAIQHDPYLLDDVGPEVVGARPREYQRPLNEVERARLAATPPGGLQRVAAPAVPIGPAPVAAPSYPAGPAPVAAPYPGALAPIVTSPPPAAPAPQALPFQYQQRPPY